MASARTVAGIYRSCCIVDHLGSGGRAGFGQSGVGVVDHHLLAEGVDVVGGAPGNGNLERTGGNDAHRIADAVAPQAVRRGDHKLVDSSFLHLPRGERTAFGSIHRDEFIERVGVHQQPHPFASGARLNAEKALAGVVVLPVAQLRSQTAVLLAVRAEGYAAVEENLQIRPYLRQRIRPLAGHYALENGQKPRGHPR